YQPMNQSTPSGPPWKRRFKRYSLIVLSVLVLLVILGHFIPISSKKYQYAACSNGGTMDERYSVFFPANGHDYSAYKAGTYNPLIFGTDLYIECIHSYHGY